MLDPAAEFLSRFRRLAVVGCSASPEKDAHRVPRYLQARGFDVVPVNPHHAEVLGRASHATVLDVPESWRREPFGVVVFRPSEEAPRVAERAVAAGAAGLWLQLGIAHPEARRVAEEAGLLYVEDRCIMVEHRRLARR